MGKYRQDPPSSLFLHYLSPRDDVSYTFAWIQTAPSVPTPAAELVTMTDNTREASALLSDYYTRALVAYTTITPVTSTVIDSYLVAQGTTLSTISGPVGTVDGSRPAPTGVESSHYNPGMSSAGGGSSFTSFTSDITNYVSSTLSTSTSTQENAGTTSPSISFNSQTGSTTTNTATPEAVLILPTLINGTAVTLTLAASLPTNATYGSDLGVTAAPASNTSLPQLIPQNHAGTIAGGTIGGILSSGLVVMGILWICGYGRSGSPSACIPAWVNPSRWSLPGFSSGFCCGGCNQGYGKTAGENPTEQEDDMEKGIDKTDSAPTISAPFLPTTDPMTESDLSPMAAAVTKVSDAQGRLREETEGLLHDVQGSVRSEAQGFVRNVEKQVGAQADGFVRRVEGEMTRDLETLPGIAHRPPLRAYGGPTRGAPRGSPRGYHQSTPVGRGRGRSINPVTKPFTASSPRSPPTNSAVYTQQEQEPPPAGSKVVTPSGVTDHGTFGLRDKLAGQASRPSGFDVDQGADNERPGLWPAEVSHRPELNDTDLTEDAAAKLPGESRDTSEYPEQTLGYQE